MFARIALIALALFGVLLGAAWMTPDRWRIERSVDVAAPSELVWRHLDRQEAWSEWMAGAQDLIVPYEVGPGLMRVRGDRENGRFPFEGAITTEALTDEILRVRWVEGGTLGWDPMLRLARKPLEAEMGAELDASLSNLRLRVEADARAARSIEPAAALPPGDPAQ